MKTKLLSFGLVSLHLCAWAGGPLCAARQESASSTAPAAPEAGRPADEGYVAHEWGTFTSVQGADGVPLTWRPLITTELPSFVYDRWHPATANGPQENAVMLTKASYMALQRMETPVIYFYSGREQTVNVSVQFPEGLITEWYPQTTARELPRVEDVMRIRGGSVGWDQLRVLPAAAHAELEAALPMDRSGSHYFAARRADADFVQFPTGANSAATRETEKFLFYRGIGSFKAPLQAGLTPDENQLHLANQGTGPLPRLFLVQFKKGQGSFRPLAALAAGAEQHVDLSVRDPSLPADQLQARLGAALRQALVAEGLYDREAEAMVATWQESWFGEDGLRVLYMLPRAWTDHTLPLSFTPPPKSLVRVMVGRAELITPAMERELAKQVVRFGSPEEQIQRQAVTDAQAIGLGRFLEPAVRRLTANNSDSAFNKRAWDLLQAAGKPAPKTPAVASR